MFFKLPNNFKFESCSAYMCSFEFTCGISYLLNS